MTARPLAVPPDGPPADVFAERLLFVVMDIGVILIAIAIVLCVARIIRGPTLIDRGVSADVIAVQVAALVLLLTIRLETLLVFDAVLIVSILGFVSTVAFAQFLGRRGSVR